MKKLHNAGIIGAGFIANEHVEVLKSFPTIKIVGVYDIQKEKAMAFGRKHQIPKVFESIEEILNGKLCDSVHVVVPPSVHKEMTLPFLQTGIHVFLEKPMAVSSKECQQLVQATEIHDGVKLGINHNFRFHPAFLKCENALADSSLGHIHHIISYWNVPLPQLASKNFGHWVFQSPGNVILEQAVHPLSQILALAGDVHTLQTLPTGRRELSQGSVFFDTWQISMTCEKATAQLFFSVGQELHSFGMIVICDDGQILVDNTNNLCVVQRKTRWLDFFNSYVNGRNSASTIKKQNFGNLRDYILSVAKLKTRSDSFFVSMRNSIRSFYEPASEEPVYVDGRSGARVIEICEMIYEEIVQQTAVSEKPELNTRYQEDSFDVLLIGGTGFIGRKAVERLVKAGKKVLVASRNVKMLPPIFYNPRVVVVSADIADKERMNEIIANIPVVIHLAHGGGGDTWEEIEKTMVGGTRNIAEACLEHRTKRMIHIGTIASLDLGDKTSIITGNTPIDPQPEERALYSRGKAACERVLTEMHKNLGLPVCILRPGVVIGEDGLPFHSGMGFFNQDTYCLGWNMGRNELPLVLVEDVAEAIFLAVLPENNVVGKTYNIVGDIRLTAHEYIEELGRALGRKLHYLPQPVPKLQAIEIGKWLIKRLAQRRRVPFPSYRDLKSRGLVARFDCSDIKRELGWKPEQDREAFIKRGIEVYRKK